MSESLNARRERIAEKLMMRLAIGYKSDPYKLPEYAWAAAGKFLSLVPARAEPSAQPMTPSLLEAAKRVEELEHTADPHAWREAMKQLSIAIAREEVARG